MADFCVEVVRFTPDAPKFVERAIVGLQLPASNFEGEMYSVLSPQKLVKKDGSGCRVEWPVFMAALQARDPIAKEWLAERMPVVPFVIFEWEDVTVLPD